MTIDLCIIDKDIDFICLYKRKLRYFWFDSYPLNLCLYRETARGYLDLFNRAATSTITSKEMQILIKLKIIAKKDPSLEWDFPVVMKDTIVNGTGRVFVDHYLYNKPNGKTLVIQKEDAKGEELYSLEQLQQKIPFDFSMSINNGIIYSFQKGLNFTAKRQMEHLEQKNHKLIVDEIKSFATLDMNALISFIRKDTLKYE